MISRKKPIVISVVGARPQFIKLAALAKSLSEPFRHKIIHTGQHYDFNLSRVFFRSLTIPRPDWNLEVGSGLHGKQTGRMLAGCEAIFQKQKPEMVLVYGDTNSTLAGALAASKLNLPVGHIEAGLRSFNMRMPEEVNRRLTDHMSDLLFYPTTVARKNLLSEGIKKGLVSSGDLMYELLDGCRENLMGDEELYKRFGLERADFIFLTLHRSENVDDPDRLHRFVRVLESINTNIIFPVHPHTLNNLKKFGLHRRLAAQKYLILCEPLSYMDSMGLISASRAVMTDSGGIQKEAFALGKVCMTLRTETEWVETVEAGANFIVDLSLQKIKKIIDMKPGKRSRRIYTIKGKKPSDIITAMVAKQLRLNYER